MNKKNKKEILSEELKRFNMLNEYSFYVPEGDKPAGEIDDLLLSEEDPEGEEEDVDAEIDAEFGTDLGTDAEDGEGGDEQIEDPEMEAGAEDFPEEEPVDDIGDKELSVDEPEEEVELDVTELVASTDEAKASADSANVKVDQLIGMVSKLEGQLTAIDGIGNKIDKLENELEKRAPTPEEKIEMRSLDSYPYNLKLTDFWADKEGKYDVMNTDDQEGEPKEYTLTKDDVDGDYSEAQIKRSFDDTDPYEEEEDIY